MTEYYRMSGGGNDFLVLVEPKEVPSAEQVAGWCRRGLSLGADGLFVLDRQDGGLRMRHWNADGGQAELCLNGTRCAVRLGLELGWVAKDDPSISILTGAGELTARSAGPDRVEIELEPLAEPPRSVSLDASGHRVEGWAVTVGVPHFVIFLERGLADMDLSTFGPRLRYHPFFEHGANINWVELQPGGFHIRTWERGVEAETLACGTGVLASVAAAVAAGRLELPADAHTRGGFVLSVRGKVRDGAIAEWSLAGDARIVARGEILSGADAEPG